MFINTKSAYKVAEEHARQQEAKKGKKCPSQKKKPRKQSLAPTSSKMTGTSTSDAASDISTSKSASTWLVERNSKLRREAIASIQGTITKQEGLKKETEERIKQVVEMALARLEGGNERGAVLSIKKTLLFQAEVDRIDEIVEGLDKLFMDVAAGDVKPDKYEKRAKAVLAQPSSIKKMTDDELLEEVHKHQRSAVVLACQKKSSTRCVQLSDAGSPLVTGAKGA